MKCTLVFILVLIMPFGPNLLAQGCCTAGSPSLGTLQTGLTQKNRFVISLSVESTRLTTAFRGTERIKDALGRDATVNNISFEVGYGVSSRLSLNLISNFSQRQRQVHLSDGSSFVSQGAGFGDMTILAKFALLQLNVADQRELSIGLGLRVPTGQSRIEENGVVLSYDLQPGTGSWDPLIWMYGFKGFLPRKYNFYYNATLRFPGTNANGYRIGRELNANLGGSYRCCSPFDAILQVRLRHTSRD